MRHRIASVLHIILSFAVLASSTGFVVDKHYCRGELKHTALFSKAKGCMGAEQSACKRDVPCDGHQKWAQKSCCQNTVEFLKSGQDQKNKGVYAFSLKLPVASAALFINDLFPLSISEVSLSAFLFYKPPVRTRKDIHSVLQVFRF